MSLSSESNTELKQELKLELEQEPTYNSNSNSYVNQVTLQFLMNKSQFSNYLEKKVADSISKREKKIYNKRFLDLIKMLLKKKNVDDIPSDIKFTFESLLKSCIHHFKMTDHTECVQSEYYKEDTINDNDINDNDINDNEINDTNDINDINDTNDTNDINEINDEEMRSLKVKMENMYLDNFIKSKTNTDIFIPHQKNIVLRNENENINTKSQSKIKDKGKKRTVEKLRKKKI